MPNVHCKVCKTVFYTKPFHFNKGWGKYCSSDCQYSAFRTGREVQCNTCGQKVYKTVTALGKSKSKKFFCGKSCQTIWRNGYFSGNRHANWKDGMRAYRSVLKRHKVLAVCKLCNLKDKRMLAVHHVDQNRKNNKIENLAWLCHNCHHLVHHHKNEREKLMATLV